MKRVGGRRECRSTGPLPPTTVTTSTAAAAALSRAAHPRPLFRARALPDDERATTQQAQQHGGTRRGIGEEGMRRQGAPAVGGGAGTAEDLAVAHHRVVQPHALHGRRHRPARGARRLIGQARER